MDSQSHVGMPGVYLLTMWDTICSRLGSCTSLKVQVPGCLPLTWDRAPSREVIWGEKGRSVGVGIDIGLEEWQKGGIRWDCLCHTEQPAPQVHPDGYFPEMAHQRGFLFLHFPSVPLLPISTLSHIIYLPWPPLGNKARGRNSDPTLQKKGQ